MTMVKRRTTTSTMAVPSVAYMPLISQSPILATSGTTTPFLMPQIASHRITLPRLQDLKPNFTKTVSSNLSEKLVGDVMVGTGVTLVITPFMTVVDKAIVQRAAGSHTLISSGMESLKTLARNPVAYMKSPMFLIMWSVYAATYSTANSLKTIVEHREHYRKSEQESHLGKQEDTTANDATFGKMGIFVGTTIVNSGASLLKDKTYARMFGTSGASNVPMITYGLWATRDMLVVGSSFVLPEIVSQKLQEETDLNKEDALRISQLTVPIATQFLAGPLQLLGLDFYNRPLSTMGYAQAAGERARFLASGFWSVVAARVARIAPAYSIGGVFNTKYRDMWRDRLIRKEIRELEDEHHDEAAQKEHANRLVGLVIERYADMSY